MQQKVLKAKNELHIYIKNYLLVWAEKIFKNHLINMTHGCLCSDQVDGYAKGMFMFAVSTGTTNYCSLGRRNGPVLHL
jgi:hypothetical protein